MTAPASRVAEPYAPHWLHGDERTWPETNCYVDLWIELLHAHGLDPLAALAFTLGLDFEGDQFTFFKFPHGDLRALYGIEVQELNLWKPLAVHAAEQRALGRVLAPEVDAFFLPDTAGVSYRIEHGKTTIAIAEIDLDRRELRYFHGRGYHALCGDDFAGVFRLDAHATPPHVLPPFAEIVKVGRLVRHDVPEVVQRALASTRAHLAAAPRHNPIARHAERLAEDLAWLRGEPLSSFHQYAFATVRQAGACFGLTAAFLAWLRENGQSGLDGAGAAFDRISTVAKTVQFKLARMARSNRVVDVSPDIAEMAAAWDEGMSRLTDRFAA